MTLTISWRLVEELGSNDTRCIRQRLLSSAYANSTYFDEQNPAMMKMLVTTFFVKPAVFDPARASEMA